MILKVKLLNSNAVLPKRSTAGSAGYDLSYCGDIAVTIAPGESLTLPTGIAIELPCNQYVALICARSGLGIKHGITLSNSVGVIDSDYRGEIKIGLVNLGNNAYTFHPNDRIAQMLITPVAVPDLQLSQELSDSTRGQGGFGSTGKGK